MAIGYRSSTRANTLVGVTRELVGGELPMSGVASDGRAYLERASLRAARYGIGDGKVRIVHGVRLEDAPQRGRAPTRKDPGPRSIVNREDDAQVRQNTLTTVDVSHDVGRDATAKLEDDVDLFQPAVRWPAIGGFPGRWRRARRCRSSVTGGAKGIHACDGEEHDDGSTDDPGNAGAPQPSTAHRGSFLLRAASRNRTSLGRRARRTLRQLPAG
jgi:hypothetical protein